MEISEINIHYKYQRLFQPDSLPRYVIMTGGRGSAKSFTVSTFLAWAISEFSNWKILFTRYTLKSAEISIMPEFLEKLELLGETENCHITKTSITHGQTGSQIIFSGIKTQSGNQTAKLKSIPGINCFVVDEAEEFTSEADFDTINNSIRVRGLPNLVIMILNPQSVNHWIWERFFKESHRQVYINGIQVQISTHPSVHHIHTTYHDNIDHLDEGYLAEIEQLRIANEAKWANVFGGRWRDKAQGVIFEHWTEGAFDESLPYCYGLDEGFFPDPLGLIKVAVNRRRKRVYLQEMAYSQKLSTGDVITLLEEKVRNKRDLIVADDKGRLIGDLAKAGWNVVKAHKWPGSVKDGIRTLQDWEIIVDPESYNLKTELNNYVWNDKKASIPVDEFNHLIDPTRYAHERLTRKGRGVQRRN